MCVLMCISISASFTANNLLRLSILTVVVWRSIHIWLMVDSISLVSINSKETVSLPIVDSSSVWAVDWNLSVVTTESVSVSIWVREQSSLEHLVLRGFNSRDEMAWGES